MDVAHAAVISAPLLRKAAIGFHVFVGAWMLLNGIGHQAHVLWKHHAGTLPQGADLTSLLLVGAGLLAVPIAFSFTFAPLLRNATVHPALAAIGVFAVVIAAIAVKYGFTFLRGSITLATIDAVLLVAHGRINLTAR